MEHHHTIGQLAKAAGVHVETVRYYERRGLIERPPKPAQGFRQYPAQTLRELRFVHAAKGLGFTLAEIQELLALLRDQQMTCGDLVVRAQSKRDEVRRRIRELAAIEASLDAVIARCACEQPSCPCPVFEHLPDFETHGCECGPDAPTGT